MATNFDTKNTTFAAKLDIDDSMAWPSGRLRGLAMSFFIFCTCIFASTTKTLTCIFYICTHKDIFLIFTHVCNYIYIYIYTLLFLYIYIHTWIHFIYIYIHFQYIHICIYSLDIQRPETEFSWVFRKQKYDQVERFTSRGVRQDVEGFDHYIPKKSTYC